MVRLEDARRVIEAAEKKAHEIGQPMNIAVVDGGNYDVSQRLEARFGLAHWQDVSVQVAEIARVMKRQDAPGTVLARPVGAGHPGEQDERALGTVACPNHVGARRATDVTLHDLNGQPHVSTLRTKALQFQSHGPVCSHHAQGPPPRGDR